jgi:hypothetical protein
MTPSSRHTAVTPADLAGHRETGPGTAASTGCDSLARDVTGPVGAPPFRAVPARCAGYGDARHVTPTPPVTWPVTGKPAQGPPHPPDVTGLAQDVTGPVGAQPFRAVPARCAGYGDARHVTPTPPVTRPVTGKPAHAPPHPPDVTGLARDVTGPVGAPPFRAVPARCAGYGDTRHVTPAPPVTWPVTAERTVRRGPPE